MHKVTAFIPLLALPVLARSAILQASDIRFSPAEKWSTVKPTGHVTRDPGSAIYLNFTGSWITITGSSSGAYTVTINGTREWRFSRAQSRSSRIFRASELPAHGPHNLALTYDGQTDQSLVITNVQISSASTNFGSSVDVPQIWHIALSESTVSTATLPASTSTGPIASSISSTSAHLPSQIFPSISTSSTTAFSGFDIDAENAGSTIVAGAVVGSILGSLILSLVLFWFVHRWRATRKEHDSDTRCEGGLSGATPFRNAQDGVGGYPRSMSQIAMMIPGTHQQQLHRATKDEHLSTTRAFYKISEPTPLRACPMPTSPRRPPMSSKRAKVTWADDVSHSSQVESPRPFTQLDNVPVSAAGRPPSIIVSSPSSLPPAPLSSRENRADLEQGRTEPATMTTTSAPPAPLSSLPGWSPLPQGIQTRKSRRAAWASKVIERDKRDQNGASAASQDPVEAQVVVETVVGLEHDEGRFGEEDRPGFFQSRTVMPRFPQDRGDPRMPSRHARSE